MVPKPHRILLVEDTPTQAEIAKVLLRDLGMEVRHAETAREALADAMANQPDAILLDLELPDFGGFELMRRLRAERIESAIIVVTANASVNTAVEAMREGAVDFIVKPYAKARLIVTIKNALENKSLKSELLAVKSKLTREKFFGFIGESPAMQAVYRTIEGVASSKASVFITGESGTGKELAADAIHKASPRAARPFVALNCGAIPRDLLESEIFGHVKGAFTGATENRVGAAKQADGGTLFLDEIGEMPFDMQVKLLRFVQTGSFQPVGASRPERVDVRIVCATNRNPLVEVESGRFREDLYYRLYVIPLELPPLRERGFDVILISRDLLNKYNKEENKKFSGFTPEVENIFLSYYWPGNVRQLQNVVRNIVVLNNSDIVRKQMLPPIFFRFASKELEMQSKQESDTIEEKIAMATQDKPDRRPSENYPEAKNIEYIPKYSSEIKPLSIIEKTAILSALEATSNDVSRAAALLEINPSTIYRKLQMWKKDK